MTGPSTTESPAPATGERRPTGLFVALAVTTTSGFGLLVYAMSVMLGPMADELGWSNAAISAGPTIGLAVSGLIAPAIGRAIDLNGGRRVLVAGIITGSCGLVVWSQAPGYPAFVLAWVVIGAGMAMCLYEPAFATIVRHAPRRRRQGILAVTLLGALASTIYIPLSAVLVDQYGWRPALLGLAASNLVLCLPPCLAWIPSRPTPRGRGTPPSEAVTSTGDPDAGITADELGTGGTTAPGSRTDSARDEVPRLAESSRLRRIVVAKVLGGSATKSVGIHVVAFLVAAGNDPTRAALIAGLLGIAKVAGRIAIGAAAGRHRSRGLLALCFALMGGSLLLGLTVPATAVQITMVVLFGIGSGGSTIAQPLFVVEQFGASVFGRTSGRIARVEKLATAFAPLAVGALVTLTAGYAAGWLLLAGGCVVAALVLPRSPAGSQPAA